ncbi:hypothetical protein KJ781_03935 [Patescibacteria group bacterium]|nr:hypothetical protein [Patescibacteria group bacterium]MBU1448701.1 hypothetical protein [Patescibacteria group bacterium]MBU2613273.1 hypothetical protein [Patescibacteria group bacterium]
MHLKRLSFTIALGLLLAAMLTLAVLVALKFRASSVAQAPATIETSIETPPPDAEPKALERAFIRIDNAPTTATHGASWTVAFKSNTWSTCLADLYGPDEEPFIIDPDAAKAVGAGNGSFSWTWSVPIDAPPGTWTVRLMCGSYENLWTSDVNMEVGE